MDTTTLAGLPGSVDSQIAADCSEAVICFDVDAVHHSSGQLPCYTTEAASCVMTGGVSILVLLDTASHKCPESADTPFAVACQGSCRLLWRGCSALAWQ